MYYNSRHKLGVSNHPYV